MTQVQEISNKGLTREYTVTVPHDLIEKGLLTKLEEIGQTAKIAGFRPGKIPMPVLRQRYGASARAEALDNVISETMQKTMTERNLRPAVQPKIDLVSFAEGKDVEFKMAVEVLPDVTITDFATVSLERSVADVEEKSISDAITRVAKGMREPEAAAEGATAAMGDILLIDFDGSVDGEQRPGMKSEDHRLELGSKSFIDNFEEQLVGSKAGDDKSITVTFPAEYHAKELASKQAVFKVKIKQILTAKPITMDDELAKEIGFPSLEKLQERVKEDLSGNYARISRAIVKRQLMDKLAEKLNFDVPPTMLDNEFNGIWQQIEEAKTRGQLPENEKNKSDDELRKDYRAIAERRIRLGLLLAEVAKAHKIEVAPNDMRNALMAEARRFPGQEKAVIDYYTKTEGALEQIRAPLLEDKVVDYILTQATITDKKISAEELMNTPEED
jgi:trigger factor